jgi:RNA polymerase-binding transcription factor DksA
MHMAPKRTRKPASRKPAATADVLGSIPHKNDLIKDANEEVPNFSLHMADAATDSYDRDLALSRASSERGALYEIDQALHRIRTGTYGICEYTGKAIERRRLEVIPWTRYCAAAEKELEQNGVIRPLHLAPREPVSEASLEADGPTTLEEQLEEE